MKLYKNMNVLVDKLIIYFEGIGWRFEYQIKENHKLIAMPFPGNTKKILAKSGHICFETFSSSD